MKFDPTTQIALIWSVEDVKDIRNDLNDSQCMEVLQKVKRNHDCEIGVSWLTLEITASELFPEL